MKSAGLQALVALGVVTTGMLLGAAAHADEAKASVSIGGSGVETSESTNAPKKDEGAAKSDAQGTSGAEAKDASNEESGESAEHEHAEEAEEKYKGRFGVDFVLGFGKTAVAVPNGGSAMGVLPSYRASDARLVSESFVVNASYKVIPQLSLGVFVPFALGQFAKSETGGDPRGTGALGAIEFEAEHEAELSKETEMEFALGLSLPTAQGNELPENLADLPGSAVPTADYDKGAILRAASLARGQMTNAFWEARRFGINPKIGIGYEHEGLSVEGFLWMENLIATTSDAAHSYLGELVPGVKGGYRLGSIEPALKVWANIAFAGSTEEKKVGLAVEPQIIGHFGQLKPVLGVIVPVVGPGVDPYQFVGVRAGLVTAF